MVLTSGCAAGGGPFQAKNPSQLAAFGSAWMRAAMTGCDSPYKRGPYTLAAHAAVAAADALLLVAPGSAAVYSSCQAAVGVRPVTAALPTGVTLRWGNGQQQAGTASAAIKTQCAREQLTASAARCHQQSQQCTTAK